MSLNPKVVLLFSGKRKSGKDFITNLLYERLGPNTAVILRLSGPIKSYWAESNDLKLEELLSDGAFKEQHRKDMILWSEKLRNQDHGIFCRQAIDMYRAYEKPVWIISDARRNTDIAWFKSKFSEKVKTVRVTASNDTRKKRGWVFATGVDDVASECDLDDFHEWDWIIENDSENFDEENLNNILLIVEKASNRT